MTSAKYSANKKSASYDLRRAFKQNIPPALAMLFMFAIEFIWGPFMALSSRVTGGSMGVADGTSSVIVTEGGIHFVCIFTGILFALTHYYIMSKPSVNFHLSLPVDRGTLFRNRFVASTVTVAAVLGLTLLIDVIINVSYLSDTSFILKMALAVFLESFVSIMAVYAVMTIAIVSCYTVIEGLFFGAALLGLPTVLLCSFNALCTATLNGYARTEDVFNILLFEGISTSTYTKLSLLAVFAIINPLIFNSTITADGEFYDIFTYARNGTGGLKSFDYGVEAISTKQTLPPTECYIPILLWVALIVLFAVLAGKIFVNRKSEKTGIHASNPIASHIFAIEFSTGFAIFLGYTLVNNAITDYSKKGAALLIAALFAVCYMIVIAINKRQFVFKNKKAYVPVAVTTAVAVILPMIMLSGGFGYTAYAPEADDIQYIAVSNCNTVDAKGSVNIDNVGYYPPLGMAETTLTVIEDKKDIETLLKAKEIVVLDDNYTNTAYGTFNVMYITKSGKKVVRNYKTSYNALTQAALELTSTDAYKKQLSAFLNGGDLSALDKKLELFGLHSENVTNNYTTTGLNEYANAVYKAGTARVEFFGSSEKINIQNTPELRKALAADLASADMNLRCRPEEKELCRICFYGKLYENTEDAETYSYLEDDVRADAEYIVYPSMKNTAAYLKSKVKDLNDRPYFEKDVEQAYVVKAKDYMVHLYNNNSLLFQGIRTEVEYYEEGSDMPTNYSDINEYFKDNSVTDKAEIEKLKAAARPYALLNKDDYVVAFKTRKADGKEAYQFMCIYAEDYK